jgi:ankyrin repeat protein
MWYIKIISSLALALVWEVSLAGVYEDMLDAVKRGDVRAVSQLLKRGVDAGTVDREGNSLLILAIKEGSVGTVKELLAARAYVNSRNALGETALMLAALRGDLEVVRQLLVQGAEVNPRGDWTPLIYAAVKGSVEISRLLLAYGAQINATADNGLTALMMAAREGHRELVALLRATRIPTLRPMPA